MLLYKGRLLLPSSYEACARIFVPAYITLSLCPPSYLCPFNEEITALVDMSRAFLGIAAGNEMAEDCMNAVINDVGALLDWKSNRVRPTRRSSSRKSNISSGKSGGMNSSKTATVKSNKNHTISKSSSGG